ncbi:MAG: hypothetical protein NTY64_00195, partial [Deltaproteobacteria bacterium]|nr:hypothetical protein [Deltaproteobacteria bacterium]
MGKDEKSSPDTEQLTARFLISQFIPPPACFSKNEPMGKPLLSPDCLIPRSGNIDDLVKSRQ